MINNSQRIKQHINQLVGAQKRFQYYRPNTVQNCQVEECVNSICARWETNDCQRAVFEIINDGNGNYARTKFRILGNGADERFSSPDYTGNNALSIETCTELLYDAIKKAYNTKEIQSNVMNKNQLDLTYAGKTFQHTRD